jgi:hypothetical protein
MSLTADDIPFNRPAAAYRPAPHRRTLAEVEQVFARWMPGTDRIPARVVLATYLATRWFEGDPVWTMLVGGSGIGKTELLITLTGLPDVVLESSISGPAALLSGTAKKERAKDASGGVLRKLPADRGLLLLKDFTSVLDMHRESRAEILAALREVYDGQWTRSLGTDGGRTLTWQGRVGLIAGCTTAIDAAHAVTSAMGTRFVLVRLKGSDGLATSVLTHVGRESVMREELRTAVHGLVEHPPGTAHRVDAKLEALAALGSLVALARSPVERDHQGEIRLVLDPEAPTRVLKMLAQLWRAAGVLGLDQMDAWALVQRVGMDSIPKLRRETVEHLYRATELISTTDVAEAVEHPSRTVRRALEDLTAHGVAWRMPGGAGKADKWGLTERARTWLSTTVPDLSDPIHTPSL